MNPLHGHIALRENKCHDCGGPLKDANGTCSERAVHEGSIHYAAFICNGCKRKLQESQAGLCLDQAGDDTGTLRFECRLPKKHRGQHIYDEVET